MDSVGGRKVKVSRGRFLSGSSGVNGTLCIRGTKQDYDDWGMEEWTGDKMFGYMAKASRSSPPVAHLLNNVGGDDAPERLAQSRYVSPRNLRTSSHRAPRPRPHFGARQGEYDGLWSSLPPRHVLHWRDTAWLWRCAAHSAPGYPQYSSRLHHQRGKENQHYHQDRSGS